MEAERGSGFAAQVAMKECKNVSDDGFLFAKERVRQGMNWKD